MAKKSSIEKQKKRERMVKRYAERRKELKAIVHSPTVSMEEKYDANIALNKLPKNSSAIRLRNRCQLTGRARGYLRKFKMSRICFRELANRGMIPGVFKASW